MNQINKGNYGPGEGGFQNLILELRGNLTENTLSINYATKNKIKRYAGYDGGKGGFEGRLKYIWNCF